MTDPRWTEETEELAATAWYKSETPDHDLPLARISSTGDRYREHARAVLTALADAGLLLPPGVETREEWAVWLGPPENGHAGRSFTHPSFAVAEIEERKSLGRDWPGEVRQRTVHTSPWREVPGVPA